MMTGHGVPETDAVGGPTRHVPVLLRPVLEALGPKDGEIFLDGTFGAGGYTRALLDAADTRVIGLDRDPEAIAAGRTLEAEAGGRLVLVQGRFGGLDRLASDFFGSPALDGVVLDIGVSSMQLDEADRGFSFRRDGPLDMRMERKGPSAADVVNNLEESELTTIIGTLGEERRARTVARAIIAARQEAPIERTLQLAGIITGAIGRGRPGEIHPATRTFQALRILVNRELDELVEALAAAERALGPGGRLAIVTFHSLEDRIVKLFLASRSGRVAQTSRHLPDRDLPVPTFTLTARKPVLADEAECAVNPRARSAKLRSAIRTEAPARPLEEDGPGHPQLPKFALPTGVL